MSLVHRNNASSPQRKTMRAIYHAAKGRCENPKRTNYSYYGARGVQFKFANLDELIAAIGMRPHPSLTLERINNDGHYEAGNVRWATRTEQQANRRAPRPYRSKHNPTGVHTSTIYNLNKTNTEL